MKKLLLSIVIMGVFAVNAFALDMVTIGQVNMRQGADMKSKIVRVVSKGEVVKVLRVEDSWVRVEDSKKNVGYIAEKYLQQIENKNKEVAKTTEVPQTKKEYNNMLENSVKEFNIKMNLNRLPEEELQRKAEKDAMEKHQLAMKQKQEKEFFENGKKTKDERLKRSLDIEQNIVFVEGEGLHRVEISLKNLNRMTCNNKISDPVYSKDKEIEIVRGGDRDLFIKINPVQKIYNGSTEIIFNDFPREMYVECNGMVYNLSLIPTDNVPSQTIVFKDTSIDTEEAIAYERSNDYEKLIKDLIQGAYVEQAPEGYKVQPGHIKYSFNELDMRLRYQYKGHNYIVEDWEIVNQINKEVELEENMFVPVIKNPRAISVTVPRLSPSESARLIAVRLNKE